MEQKHTLYMDDRQSLVVTDVKDVGSFQEEEVTVTLSEGGLVVKGEHLHMVLLNLDEGRAEFSGRIHSVSYTQKHETKMSLWERIWK